jgi:hypothetical protein
LLIAPANVLHGAVRLHGLASFPTPDTHVRVACAVRRRRRDHHDGRAEHRESASKRRTPFFIATLLS